MADNIETGLENTVTLAEAIDREISNMLQAHNLYALKRYKKDAKSARRYARNARILLWQYVKTSIEEAKNN